MAQEPRPVAPPVSPLREYLSRDIFIQPGYGLRSIHLGISFAAVEEAWGEPERKTKLLRRRFANQWHYRIGDHTMAVLVGRDSVERLIFLGKARSQYQTIDGIRFDNKPEVVRRLYGKPDKSRRRNTLAYREHGIRFKFAKNRLVEIEIAPPD